MRIILISCYRSGMRVAIICSPCYGFGDIIFALKVHAYLKSWPFLERVLVTTDPKAFVKNKVHHRKLRCLKTPGERPQHCEDIAFSKSYAVDAKGNPQQQIHNERFDIYFVAPWVTDFPVDVDDIARIYPNATRSNTYFFSEYNPDNPQDFDFPTGIGPGLYGLLFTDPNPRPPPASLKKPYAMVHVTEDENVDCHRCVRSFLRVLARKYAINIDVIIPKHLRTSLQRDPYDSFLRRYPNITLRDDLGVLPHGEYMNLYNHCLPEVLVTGDQSVTDIIACRHGKPTVLYYQIMPWKNAFGRQLAKMLEAPHLKDEATSCGLKKVILPMNLSRIMETWDFRKRAQWKMRRILMGAYVRAHAMLFTILFVLIIATLQVAWYPKRFFKIA